MLRTFVSVVVLAACSYAEAATSCRTYDASYRMRDDPTFTAGFSRFVDRENYITDVAFYLRSERTNRTFWFLFDEGSARYINMISLKKDPNTPGWKALDGDNEADELVGEMHYLAADGSFRLNIDLPTARRPAPQYILLPDLPDVMWNRAKPREHAPMSFFVLTGCGRRLVP